VVLLGSGGDRVHALPFALLAAALGMGEAASAHRDVAAVTALHIHDLERARLARELHDVIAHQLSAIAVQAGAARMAGPGDPAAAVQAVGTIEETARQGLVELNRLVGSLRHDGADRLDRAPQPQLCDLPALVAGARDAGLPVQLLIRGEPGPLPATVELAGYRVVQESVTNALRYATGAPTRVTITYAASGLDIAVTDDGSPGPHGRPHPSGGRGLAGLAERAAILGGHLEAGRLPGHGFAVHAWLPAER
jgi:signal transduction histidine kinase